MFEVGASDVRPVCDFSTLPSHLRAFACCPTQGSQIARWQSEGLSKWDSVAHEHSADHIELSGQVQHTLFEKCQVAPPLPRDGANADTFHERCDGHGPTVTVAGVAGTYS